MVLDSTVHPEVGEVMPLSTVAISHISEWGQNKEMSIT